MVESYILLHSAAVLGHQPLQLGLQTVIRWFDYYNLGRRLWSLESSGKTAP